MSNPCEYFTDPINLIRSNRFCLFGASYDFYATQGNAREPLKNVGGEALASPNSTPPAASKVIFQRFPRGCVFLQPQCKYLESKWLSCTFFADTPSSSGARIVKHWRRKTGFSANGSIYKRVNRVEIPAIFKEIMLWRII